jgi:hypothetical protein
MVAMIAPRPSPEIEMYWDVIVWRVMGVVLVASADVWLAMRWFQDKNIPHRHGGGLFRNRWRVGLGRSSEGAFSDRMLAPSRMAILGRLLWQQGRQSLSLLLAVSAVLILMASFPAGQLFVESWGLPGSYEIFGTPLLMLSLVGISLLGLCVFAADQRRRSYRFLADRGVPPGSIWLSRLLVVLIPFVLLLAVFLLSIRGVAPRRWSFESNEIIYYYSIALKFVFGAAVLGLTAGQLCSMFFRSSILAGLFGVLLNILLVGWWGLMMFWQVPWIWSALPLPLAFLLATRLRTANWLLERNTLRAWLLPALILLLPTVALVTAVPLYRIHQIPDVWPGFDFKKFEGPLTQQERATLDLYRNGILQLNFIEHPSSKTGTPEFEKAAASLRQEGVAMIVKASSQELIHPILGESPLDQAAYLLLINAKRTQEAGDLDSALKQYLAVIRICDQMRRCDIKGCYSADDYEMQTYSSLARWAARPGQTPTRILDAEHEVRRSMFQDTSRGPVELEYGIMRRILNGDLAALSATHVSEKRPLSTLTLLWMRLPWERARALRLLNFQTYCELHDPSAAMPVQSTLAPLRNAELLYTLWEQTGLPWVIRDLELWWCDWRYPSTSPDRAKALETKRRATYILLALEAWKLEHGSLPKKLDALVGPYFDRLPEDPFSGEPFRYFPDGLPVSLRWSQLSGGWTTEEYRGELPANTPFLWSIGERVSLTHSTAHSIEQQRNVLDEYQIWLPWPHQQGPHSTRFPNSESDLWSSGWPFVIP